MHGRASKVNHLLVRRSAAVPGASKKFRSSIPFRWFGTRHVPNPKKNNFFEKSRHACRAELVEADFETTGSFDMVNGLGGLGCNLVVGILSGSGSLGVWVETELHHSIPRAVAVVAVWC
jgi:hypothetical protein